MHVIDRFFQGMTLMLDNHSPAVIVCASWGGILCPPPFHPVMHHRSRKSKNFHLVLWDCQLSTMHRSNVLEFSSNGVCYRGLTISFAE
jgi:hypothetical protein